MNRLYTLLLGKLSPLRLTLFTLTQVIGMALIALSLYLYFDARSAIASLSGQSDYIVINKKVGLLDSFIDGKGEFSEREVKRLKGVEGVMDVGEFISSQFRVSGGVTIPSMGGYRSEMFFEAVDDRFVDSDNPDWSYKQGSGVIPIILPKNYLNLYNIGFSQGIGTPRVSEGVVKSVAIDIVITDKNGKNHRFKGRVVDFSNRINSILAPKEFVQWANNTLAGSDDSSPRRLIAKINPAMSSTIESYIEEQGYELEGKMFNAEGVNTVLGLVVTALLIIGVVITILSLSLLLLTFYLIIERGREKIAALLLIGYPTTEVIKPYTIVANRLITVSFAVAITLSAIIRHLYIRSLESRLDFTTSYINIIIPLTVLIVLFVTIIIVVKRMVHKGIS